MSMLQVNYLSLVYSGDVGMQRDHKLSVFWCLLDVQAYLPQTTLIIFLALLPSLLMFFSRLEGIPSQSHLVRAASGKYFYFIVFNVFIGVTLFGAIFSSIAGFKELLSSRNLSISNVVSLFGNKVPPVAAYFITYVALQ